MHTPLQGLQFLKYHLIDPEFKAPAAWYVVSMIINGGEDTKARIIGNVNMLITVSALLLSVSVPMMTELELGEHTRTHNLTSDPVSSDDRIIVAYYASSTLAVFCNLWTMMMGFGYSFTVQQCIRDIDLVHTINVLGFMEFKMCFMPFVIGFGALSSALAIKGLLMYNLEVTVPFAICFVVLNVFSYIWTLVKGWVPWYGLLHTSAKNKTHPQGFAWEENKKIALTIIDLMCHFYEEDKKETTISNSITNITNVIDESVERILSSSSIVGESDEDEDSHGQDEEKRGGFGFDNK